MIYVLLANGFEECEAIAPIDILRRANANVVTVAINNNNELMVCGSHNIKIAADIYEDNIVFDDEIEMLVLPGGGVGVGTLAESETVKKLILFCVGRNIKIGAICAAPSILANMGLLKGKKSTAYPTFQKYLVENDAEVSEKFVLTDGIFTTARGAGVSVEFGLRLVSELYGKNLSDKIKSEIQCQ